MIPEWCKRAVEEIDAWYEHVDQPLRTEGLIAAIVAKHASDSAYQKVMAAGVKLMDERETQIRELVEAAREALLMVGQSLPTAISDDKKWWESQANCLMRLDRALEPFNEVS